MFTSLFQGRILSVAAVLCLAANAAGQASESDMKKLQGTWVCVASYKDGKAVQNYIGVKALIKGNELIWYFPKPDGSFSEQKNLFRIDSGKEPRHFDWWRNDKTAADADMRIYSVDGDTLRWGTNLDYKTRPKSFDKAVWQFTARRAPDRE